MSRAAGRPTTLVAVCGGPCCDAGCEEIIERLRPIVRSTPGAVLVRADCWRPSCAEDAAGTQVVVRAWPSETGRSPGRSCELRTTDSDSCARAVSRWLSIDGRWGALRR